MMDLGDGLLTERKTMSATKGGNVWTGKQLSLWATPLWESDRSLRRLQWLTALGLIVASMAMLANWAAWHLPVQLPSGVLPAAGLLVIALIAEWVHFLPRSFAAFRVTLIVLAVAGSIAVAIELPMAVSIHAGARYALSVVPWLRSALVILLALFVGKLFLLNRFATVAVARRRWARLDLERLFSCQSEDLDDLCRAIAASPLDLPGQLVQFVGRWGDGKSFLLHHLPSYAAQNTELNLSLVVVDVWKHETEPDLHLAIFEELLGDHRYLLNFGWLRYPVSLLIGRFVGTAREALTKMSIKAKGLSVVDVPIQLPRLAWQRSFERLVRHQRDRGRRTVIVLDEIDRATPYMAQAALTLTRRSLDLAGVTVVVSYVDSLIRYKAFNPLLVDRESQSPLPDLGSTMEAILFEEAAEREPGATRTRLQGEDLRAALRSGYASTSAAIRRQLQERFSEKYLGTRRVRLRRMSLTTVAQIPFQLDTLKEQTRRLIGDAGMEQNKAYLEAAEALLKARDPGLGVPSIRQLEGTLFSILSVPLWPDGFFGPTGEAGRAADWASLVAAAYEFAAL